jgi:alpha-mannosidase
VVEVDATGAIAIEHLASGRRFEEGIVFVDEADVGDLYTPAPRPHDTVVECRGVKPIHRGPLRGELQASYRVRDPQRRAADVDLSLNLVLDADSRFLRVEVTGTNHRKDHRLRIVFRTDVTDATVWADAAFTPVRRDPMSISKEEAAVEQAPPTAPLHRYVSVCNDVRGATVFSDGLAEYESSDGDVLVTLVRSVGELSRNDLPERPGHAGWPTPTPRAQCLGPFHAVFAFMPHGPRLASTVDEIERTADDVLLPLVGTTLRSALDVPGEVVGVELVGDGLALSAIKESETGDWLILRCVNRRDEPRQGAWRLPFDVREAHLARLDETPVTPILSRSGEVTFTAAPFAIVTMLVR